MEISSPYRVTRTYVQRIAASPERVFPLLCPVREADWIEGWGPIAVWSGSGVAERDCVFVTETDDHRAVWYITEHSPEEGFVEMLRITPGVTACRLTIRLSPGEVGTDAQVTYSHTSLGPAGDEFVASFTEEHYLSFMREWEARMNHYLKTGSAL